jgi:nitrite reductase/ring-hydroxylating ferredoxin subunit
MSWATLCTLDELTEGAGKYIEIDGFHLAVFLDKGEVRAIDDICPHAGGSLATGFIDDGCVVCPLHFWTFHLENGQLKDSPGCAITTYKTRLKERADGPPFVQVELPQY